MPLPLPTFLPFLHSNQLQIQLFENFSNFKVINLFIHAIYASLAISLHCLASAVHCTVAVFTLHLPLGTTTGAGIAVASAAIAATDLHCVWVIINERAVHEHSTVPPHTHRWLGGGFDVPTALSDKSQGCSCGWRGRLGMSLYQQIAAALNGVGELEVRTHTHTHPHTVRSSN